MHLRPHDKFIHSSLLAALCVKISLSESVVSGAFCLGNFRVSPGWPGIAVRIFQESSQYLRALWHWVCTGRCNLANRFSVFLSRPDLTLLLNAVSD